MKPDITIIAKKEHKYIVAEFIRYLGCEGFTKWYDTPSPDNIEVHMVKKESLEQRSHLRLVKG